MTDDQRFKKWDEWLEAIYKDVQWLLIMRHICWEVQEIIRANPRIQKPSTFYQWMGSVYATAATIGVRRQLDKDRRSISLARLLEEIQCNPKVLSRARYVSLYRNPHLRAVSADRDFDQFAGPGKPHVDPDKFNADLKELEAKAEKLERYATKRVAHFDERGPKSLPTF